MAEMGRKLAALTLAMVLPLPAHSVPAHVALNDRPFRADFTRQALSLPAGFIGRTRPGASLVVHAVPHQPRPVVVASSDSELARQLTDWLEKEEPAHWALLREAEGPHVVEGPGGQLYDVRRVRPQDQEGFLVWSNAIVLWPADVRSKTGNDIGAFLGFGPTVLAARFLPVRLPENALPAVWPHSFSPPRLAAYSIAATMDGGTLAEYGVYPSTEWDDPRDPPNGTAVFGVSKPGLAGRLVRLSKVELPAELNKWSESIDRHVKTFDSIRNGGCAWAVAWTKNSWPDISVAINQIRSVGPEEKTLKGYPREFTLPDVWPRLVLGPGRTLWVPFQWAEPNRAKSFQVLLFPVRTPMRTEIEFGYPLVSTRGTEGDLRQFIPSPDLHWTAEQAKSLCRAAEGIANGRLAGPDRQFFMEVVRQIRLGNSHFRFGELSASVTTGFPGYTVLPPADDDAAFYRDAKTGFTAIRLAGLDGLPPVRASDRTIKDLLPQEPADERNGKPESRSGARRNGRPANQPRHQEIPWQVILDRLSALPVTDLFPKKPTVVKPQKQAKPKASAALLQGSVEHESRSAPGIRRDRKRRAVGRVSSLPRKHEPYLLKDMTPADLKGDDIEEVRAGRAWRTFVRLWDSYPPADLAQYFLAALTGLRNRKRASIFLYRHLLEVSGLLDSGSVRQLIGQSLVTADAVCWLGGPKGARFIFRHSQSTVPSTVVDDLSQAVSEDFKHLSDWVTKKDLSDDITEAVYTLIYRFRQGIGPERMRALLQERMTSSAGKDLFWRLLRKLAADEAFKPTVVDCLRAYFSEEPPAMDLPAEFWRFMDSHGIWLREWDDALFFSIVTPARILESLENGGPAVRARAWEWLMNQRRDLVRMLLPLSAVSPALLQNALADPATRQPAYRFFADHVAEFGPSYPNLAEALPHLLSVMLMEPDEFPLGAKRRRPRAHRLLAPLLFRLMGSVEEEIPLDFVLAIPPGFLGLMIYRDDVAIWPAIVQWWAHWCSESYSPYLNLLHPSRLPELVKRLDGTQTESFIRFFIAQRKRLPEGRAEEAMKALVKTPLHWKAAIVQAQALAASAEPFERQVGLAGIEQAAMLDHHTKEVWAWYVQNEGTLTEEARVGFLLYGLRNPKLDVLTHIIKNDLWPSFTKAQRDEIIQAGISEDRTAPLLWSHLADQVRRSDDQRLDLTAITPDRLTRSFQRAIQRKAVAAYVQARWDEPAFTPFLQEMPARPLSLAVDEGSIDLSPAQLGMVSPDVRREVERLRTFRKRLREWGPEVDAKKGSSLQLLRTKFKAIVHGAEPDARTDKAQQEAISRAKAALRDFDVQILPLWRMLWPSPLASADEFLAWATPLNDLNLVRTMARLSPRAAAIHLTQWLHIARTAKDKSKRLPAALYPPLLVAVAGEAVRVSQEHTMAHARVWLDLVRNALDLPAYLPKSIFTDSVVDALRDLSNAFPVWFAFTKTEEPPPFLPLPGSWDELPGREPPISPVTGRPQSWFEALSREPGAEKPPKPAKILNLRALEKAVGNGVFFSRIPADRLRRDDRQRLIELYEHSGVRLEGQFEELLDAIETAPNHFGLWVARDDQGRVQAFALAQADLKSGVGRSIIAVTDPKWSRKGLGRRLLALRLGWLLEEARAARAVATDASQGGAFTRLAQKLKELLPRFDLHVEGNSLSWTTRSA